MRRGSGAREVWFLDDDDQGAAITVASSAITDAVEVQDDQVGASGCTHAADGLTR